MGIVIVARVSSVIYSLLKTSFYTQLIGGSIVDEASYKLASMSILGSFMIAASTAMNMVQGEPVVFRESPTLHSLLTHVIKAFSNIGSKNTLHNLFHHRFCGEALPRVKVSGCSNKLGYTWIHICC